MITGVSNSVPTIFRPASRGGASGATPQTAGEPTAGAPPLGGDRGGAVVVDLSADPASGQQLSQEEQQQVSKLRQVDAEVRQHEAAHQAAGGAHAGGVSYEFVRGPDGKNYAVAGEVPVDLSREGSPEATIRKMEQVKAAALAPADPSPQDMRVAAQADAIKADAQAELRRERSAALGPSKGGGAEGGPEGAGSYTRAGSADGECSCPPGQPCICGAGSYQQAEPAGLAARGAAAYGAASNLRTFSSPRSFAIIV